MAAEEQNKSSAKRGRRRGRRRRSNNRGNSNNTTKRDGLHPEALAAIPQPLRREPTRCPLCDKTVRDVHSAIAYGEGGKPAHLDCVINELGDGEQIGTDERLCYIGAGRFGVIKSRVGKDGLEVVRTIQYEARESVVAWRRELSPGLSRASVDDPIILEPDQHHDNGDSEHQE